MAMAKRHVLTSRLYYSTVRILYNLHNCTFKLCATGFNSSKNKSLIEIN